MKISPIIRARISTNCVQRSIFTENKNNYVSDNNLSFGGKVNWGGAIGSVVGTLAGIGLGAIATVATGGLAVPIIAGMAGAAAGGIGGSAINDKINKNSSSSSDDRDNVGADLDSEFEKARMNNY